MFFNTNEKVLNYSAGIVSGNIITEEHRYWGTCWYQGTGMTQCSLCLHTSGAEQQEISLTFFFFYLNKEFCLSFIFVAFRAILVGLKKIILRENCTAFLCSANKRCNGCGSGREF